MEKESSIKELISNSLDQIRTIIDADTVVGRQIVTPTGTTIIPISKVSMGFASGGLDLPVDKSASKNFGGGGGTGVTVNPIGFLVVYGDGRVEMLPMSQEKASPIEQVADILDHTPDIINRIKSVLNNETPAANDNVTAEQITMQELAYEQRLNDLADGKKAKKKKKI